MLAVLASESSPAAELAVFKTNMKKFCACTKLQFNSITITNLIESSHIHFHTAKLPNNLESLKFYLSLIQLIFLANQNSKNHLGNYFILKCKTEIVYVTIVIQQYHKYLKPITPTRCYLQLELNTQTFSQKVRHTDSMHY